VSFVMQPFRFIAGTRAPRGVTLSIKNAGRNEEEARKFWGDTLRRLEREISGLPREFGLSE
jgi:hypothetical protein